MKSMVEKKRSTKRYTFELPADIYEQLSLTAEQNGTTVVEMLRKYIKLGLLATQPDTVVLLRIGESEQPVMLVL